MHTISEYFFLILYISWLGTNQKDSKIDVISRFKKIANLKYKNIM